MNRHPSGFTLVELLVVVVVAGLLMAAVFQTLIVQQRGYRQQYSVTNARQASRTTLDLLAVELRELSAATGDLAMASQDSLRFRSYRKAGLVCAMPDLTTLIVREFGSAAFVAEDSVLVYQEENDDWVAALVEGAESATCPDGSLARKLEISSDVSPAGTGAPVRGYRMAAYGLELIDGKWALARRDQGEGAVSLVEPLASREQGGLQFLYYNAASDDPFIPSGSAGLADVKRVEVVVRGISLGTGNAAQREHLDSLSLQVNLRGN
jgi:prepilin-type N-terminal cleavage/methylation domain-containing protein